MGGIPLLRRDAVRAVFAVTALMVGASAHAADQALPAATPPLSWTGFYVGGSAGYGWAGRTSFNLTGLNDAGRATVDPASSPFIPPIVAVNSGSLRPDGAFAGIQAGYNWQFARSWVAGIEADFSMSSVGDHVELHNATPPGFVNFFRTTAGRNLEWFGTVRARLGFLATENLLIYGTGGLAYGRDKASATVGLTAGGFLGIGGQPDGSTFGCTSLICLSGSGSRTSSGWTAGGGLEYALSNNWTIKAEYLHIDLDLQQTVLMRVVAPATGTALVSAAFGDYSVDIVRVGMNYKFGLGRN